MHEPGSFSRHLADAMGAIWDFIDKRDLDKHAMAWVIVALTIKISLWSMSFATATNKTGTDIAAILATVWVPWSGVQAMVVRWYFNTKTGLPSGEGDPKP